MTGLLRRWPSRRVRGWTLVLAALAALAACALLGSRAPQQALLSYLVAYLFWLAPVLGSIGLLLVHALTGGDWGRALQPALLAASRRLPLMALLLLPLLLGMRLLYPWAMPGAEAADPALLRQRWYLDDGFFVLRAVVCMGLWLGLAHAVRRHLRTAGRVPTPVAAGGLIVFACSVTVAGVDWVMSLVPRWHSSTFGLWFGTGLLLAAAALAVLRAVTDTATRSEWTSRRLNDLGSLLLLLVLGWSYLAFMDYLTAWIADLPSETVWYLPRLQTPWRWLGVFLVLFHLVLPFAVLLSRRARRRRAWLAAVAATLWVAHLGAVAWLVLPGLRTHGSLLAWTDPLAMLGIGGLWWRGYRDAARANDGPRRDEGGEVMA